MGWMLDRRWIETDADGWRYARDFSEINTLSDPNNDKISIPFEKSGLTGTFVRRRRWVSYAMIEAAKVGCSIPSRFGCY